MNREKVEIKAIDYINHNVLKIVTNKPKNYSFEPGQATDLAINNDDWKDKKRPFTFTSLPTDDELQFTIKVYPSHNGVTEQLASLNAGDTLTIGEAYGAIKYKGKGMFLAGGAGVTPFIAILKSLDKNNELDGNLLLFANKTEKDIFLKDSFQSFLGSDNLNILSEEKSAKHLHGHIDTALLKNTITDFSQYFYVCGPPKMIETLTENLKGLGVNDKYIVIEDFED